MPTFTVSIQQKYHSELKKLFDRFAQGIIWDFEKQHETKFHALQDVPALTAMMKARVTKSILDPADRVVEYMTRVAYQSGIRRSSTHLKAFNIAIDEKVGFADWRVLDALQVRNLEHLRGITDDMEQQILDALAEGIDKGEGSRALGKRIFERVDVSKSRAQVFARTETIAAHTEAAKTRYAQAGIQKIEWLRGGLFPCQFEPQSCVELEGQVFELKGEHPEIPLHPSCMCTWLPVVEA